MARIVAQPVEIGPFFVGDRLPNLFVQLFWDTGGAVDLADWPAATFAVYRKKGTVAVQSGSKLAGDITYQVTSNGELTVIWPAAFTEPGQFRMRLTLADAGTKQQSAQEVTFEVQER